jgi:SHAQKYF class myb-like DNA-binding protein
LRLPEQQQQQQHMYPPGMMFSPPQQQAAPWGYAPMPYYYPSQSQFQAPCMNQAFPYPVSLPPSAMEQRRFAFYPGVYQEAPIGEEEEDIDDKAKALKKSRLVWTKELHTLFLAAIERCGGIHKASPKAIMKDMNVDGLTRENVASHLQKYRMRLKRYSSQEQHDVETDDTDKRHDH